jgi:hypothetical protein
MIYVVLGCMGPEAGWEEIQEDGEGRKGGIPVLPIGVNGPIYTVKM